MNQSAEPTLWPLISVCVSEGEVPRMLTRLASANAPSPPELELMLTPGRRCTVSAPFLLFREFAYDARMPLTSTTCVSAWVGDDAAASGAGAAVCARAGLSAPDMSSVAANAK